MLRLVRAALFAAAAALPLAAAGKWQVLPFEQAIIMGVDFLDANNGYIAGGDNDVGPNILRTSDGGQTWSSLPIAPVAMLMSVAVGDSMDSAIAAGLGVLAPATLYNAGGKQFLNSSMPEVSLQQSQDAQRVGDAGFAVVGEFGFWGQNGSDAATVAFSDDNGASFQFSQIQDDSGAPARYASFPTNKFGIVALGSWPTSKSRALLAKPLSRRVHLHAPRRGSAHRRAGRLHFEQAEPELIATDDDDAPASGWIGVLYRSTDGFQSWQKVYSNSSFYFNQVSCASERVCYAVAENDATGFALRSTDGGDSWETILAASGVSMMVAHAVSEKEVWVGGGSNSAMNGTLFHSIDGGSTFDVQYVPGVYFNDVSCPDSGVCFASAMNANQQCNVLKYTN